MTQTRKRASAQPPPATNSLLIRDCDVVVTMDDAGTEIGGGSIFIEEGTISWVGAGSPPRAPAQTIDGRGTVAIPGLINAHHHLFQSFTRVRGQSQGLFGWLQELYPVWAGVDLEWMRSSARVGLAELALSGCSTTTDHHYVFPNGVTGIIEEEVHAAGEIGLRFHPCRGSMDLGRSQGGLPPDSIVEDPDRILAETEGAINRLHDPRPGAMVKIAVAPCSPFSVSPPLMRESAALARRLGVRLHTHIAETIDEEAYCRQKFDRRPIELLDDLGWLGPDVWLAHCVHLNGDDIRRIARTGSAVAWCPTSNLRLGSGIAPARDLIDAGAAVGLAVDGSASNDTGHMLAEVRQAMLVTRGRAGAAAMTAREALRVATRGGAACLGREDLGSLEVGKRGDVALFSIDGLSSVGAEVDPVAALVFAPPPRVRDLLVEGRFVVQHERLKNIREEQIIREANRKTRRLSSLQA